MNEMLLALLALIVLWSVVWWMIVKKHNETYTEILITYPFDSLKKGKVAVFKSDVEAKVGDYVLIHLPGYEMIWKVVKEEREKMELVNRKGEKLVGFPKCYLWGKMIGYKGEEFEEC